LDQDKGTLIWNKGNIEIPYSLKYSRTVSYAKEYYQVFEELAFCAKYSFLLIICLNLHIVETSANIQFSKTLGTMKLQDKLRDEGK